MVLEECLISMKIKKAFTLIELLVVVAIIGILSGFVVISLNGAMVAARDAKVKTNLDTIKKAIIISGIANNGSYPIDSDCNVGSCPNLDLVLSQYLPGVVDGIYTYQSNGTTFTLSSTLSTGYSYKFDSATNSYSSNTPGAGTCGTKNGKYASSTPTGAEACTNGTITGMTGSYSWTCVNGGISSGVCATVAPTYIVQSFTTVGTSTWTVPTGVTSVDYLVVAGGGGSGYVSSWGNIHAGGGGAGGLLHGSITGLSGVQNITVGEGGAGGTSGGSSSSNGSNSAFGSTLIAIGGGAGGWGGNSVLPGNGGSGGAAGGHTLLPGSVGGDSEAGPPRQGYAGGISSNNQIYGAGGGGYSGVGHNTSADGTGLAAGGAGYISDITGVSIVYATGGSSGYNTNAGAPNTGNGGNTDFTGADVDGSMGGSGVVIIKYINNY